MKVLVTNSNPDIAIETINILGDNFASMNSENALYTTYTININPEEKNRISELHHKLKNYLYSKSIDYLIYPNTQKKLLFCDMDKTLVDMETMDTVAEIAGIGEQIKNLTLQAMEGIAQITVTCAEKLRLMKGINIEHINSVLKDKVVLSNGADVLAEISKKYNMHRIISSGGYDYFVKHVFNILEFDNYYCNTLEIENGIITGEVVGKRLDEHSKKEQLLNEVSRMKIDLSDAIAVGDGANDIPMLETAGLGIAFFGKDLVKKHIENQINFTDLSTIAKVIEDQNSL